MADFIYAGDGGAFQQCEKCSAVKPVQLFRRRGKGERSAFGFRGECIECHKGYHKEWRQSNPEAINRYYQAYKETHAEHIVAKAKEYYQANKGDYYERTLRWREENPDRYAEAARAWRADNPEKTRSYSREWRERNPEVAGRWAKENPDKARQYVAEWRARNVEKVRLSAREHMRTKLATPRGRLEAAIKGGIIASIKTGSKNRRKTFDLLGYTADDLFRHLERQFSPGMTWKNYGEWEVDHILPISSFSYDTPDCEQFRACWALTNLRPLWRRENRSKRDKVLYLL